MVSYLDSRAEKTETGDPGVHIPLFSVNVQSGIAPPAEKMMKQRIFLGLGTNLGDRFGNLQKAITSLEDFTELTAVSPLYETPPWGVLEQPAFINMAAGGWTDLPPHELLAALKQLEREIGRRKTIKWGPRLIDIDILFYGDLVLDSGSLQIPHPHMHERPFVIGPLADIAPQHIHPLLGETVAEMFAVIEDGSLKRLPDKIRLKPPAA